MPTGKPESTLGVLIDVEDHYGTEHVCVRVMRRRPGDHHPLGITYGVFEDYGDCADLILDGFVSEYNDHQFIGFKPFYDRPHQVELGQAKAMARVLTKIRHAVEKDHATTHTDVFTAFCKGIGAKWVCHHNNRDKTRRSSLPDNEWRWMSVPEGREYLRHMIAQVQAKAKGEAA